MINKSGDIRAASLKLRLYKKPSKEYANFTLPPRATDDDRVKSDRMDMCRQIRYRAMK